jgi:cyclin L
MAPISPIERLSNPLVTAGQLLKFQNSNGTDSLLYFAQFHLTFAAGPLLRLPQEVIARAIVLLQRFLVSSRAEDREGFSPKIYSAASVHLAAKVSATPVSPRSVINVFAYLMSKASSLPCINVRGGSADARPQEYYVSEGTYQKERQRLFICESMILAGIGFDTQVALPYTIALTYMQALGASSSTLAQRVFEHLNAGLLSPQLLYLTHQPNALAVGAIYLAAREVGVKLVEQNWWEVFDVDREDLGFLVLSYGSVANLAEAEMQKWIRNPVVLG